MSDVRNTVAGSRRRIRMGEWEWDALQSGAAHIYSPIQVRLGM